jgi:hypothetical protein
VRADDDKFRTILQQNICSSIRKKMPHGPKRKRLVTAFWEEEGCTEDEKEKILKRETALEGIVESTSRYAQTCCAALVFISGIVGIILQVSSPFTAVGCVVYAVSGLSMLMTVSTETRRYAKKVFLRYLPDIMKKILYEK